MRHICVSKLTTIGSDNGLSPSRRQAVIWTKAGILLIRTLGTNFSEILSEIHAFSFKKMHLKMSSAKWRPFCLGLNVLKFTPRILFGVIAANVNRSQIISFQEYFSDVHSITGIFTDAAKTLSCGRTWRCARDYSHLISYKHASSSKRQVVRWKFSYCCYDNRRNKSLEIWRRQWPICNVVISGITISLKYVTQLFILNSTNKHHLAYFVAYFIQHSWYQPC